MEPRPTVVAIVDDDPRLLESLGDLLESAGFRVRAFSSATALLEEASLNEIDCLVTDIGMPVIDGHELRRRATRLRPSLPVIFITGDARGFASARSGDASDSECFHKPFDSNALIASICRVVPAKP